jgi:hypothetical protein
MKMVKSLVLGSAAAVLAMTGAQAADLPVKAKAVEYVRICSLYGAGFFYIPGTDTCIKLGGYVRIDTTFNGSVYDQPAWSADLGQGNRFRDYFASRSRMALTVDTRTATEYGVVRTFGQADFQFTTQGNNTVNPAAFTAAPQAGTQTSLLNQPGEGYVAVEMVFIQFAGFTFGKSASAYATPWHGYPGNNSSFLLGGHDTVTGVNNIQYSAQFGNGVSGTIGLDDPIVFNRTSVFNLAGGTAFTGAGALGNNYGGDWAPDVVGNIRVDQAWGLFQISAAGHMVNGSYNILNPIGTPAVGSGFTALAPGTSNTFSEISGHPETKWGGSVMAALQIKNIPTGAGDDIKMSGSWSLGASHYVLGTSAADPSSFDIYSGTKFAMGVVTDSIYSGASAVNPLTQQQLTRGWGFQGAYNHNWDPYWSTSLFGGIAGLSYNQTAKQLYCNTYVANPGIAIRGGGVTGGGGSGGTFGAGSVCDPGFTISEIGLVTRWTPVKNLTFSAEVLYAYLKTNMSGTITGTPSSALPLAPTTYAFGNNGTASLNLRVQRNF